MSNEDFGVTKKEEKTSRSDALPEFHVLGRHCVNMVLMDLL